MLPASGPSASAPQDPILVTVGDIGCTQDSVVLATGRYPLRRTTWIVTNQTATTQVIPTYAIVLAIIFALACLLGLLFLLVKETRTSGFVQVSVQGDQLFYATQVPVSHPMQVVDTEQRVNYIRGLVATLG